MVVGGAGYVRLVALEKHPGGLDDEEWVAPGLVSDPARGWFIERLAGDQGQLLGIVGSQRVQSQGDRVLDPTAPLGPNVQEFVASRAQDEQWHPMVPPEQFLDQLQQIWLGQLRSSSTRTIGPACAIPSRSISSPARTSALRYRCRSRPSVSTYSSNRARLSSQDRKST